VPKAAKGKKKKPAKK